MPHASWNGSARPTSALRRAESAWNSPGNSTGNNFNKHPINPPSDKLSGDTREKFLSYWRRRGTFYGVVGAAVLLTMLLTLLLPPTYRATGTILIEQQEIPQELVRSVITSFADQRVQVISQRVMTSQNLLSLIERYNLYPDIREKQPREVLLAKMRKDIGMHMISADVIDPRSGRPTQATIAFS